MLSKILIFGSSLFLSLFITFSESSRSRSIASVFLDINQWQCHSPIYIDWKQDSFWIVRMRNDQQLDRTFEPGEEFTGINTHIDLFINEDKSGAKKVLLPGAFVVPVQESGYYDYSDETVQKIDNPTRSNQMIKVRILMTPGRADNSVYQGEGIRKNRNIHQDFIQMNREHQDPEQIRSMENYQYARNGEIGYIEFNSCTSSDRRRRSHTCSPAFFERGEDQYYAVNEDLEIHSFQNDEPLSLERGEVYKLVRQANIPEEAYLPHGFLSRRCRRVGTSDWVVYSYFLAPIDYEVPERSSRNDFSVFKEFNPELLRGGQLKAIPKSKFRMFDHLRYQFSIWDMEFDGDSFVPLRQSRRARPIFTMAEMDFFDDMNLVRIPNYPRILAQERSSRRRGNYTELSIFSEGPFGSYHYLTSDEQARTDDYRALEDPSHDSLREHERDSYLHPITACAFTSFLKKYNRDCIQSEVLETREQVENGVIGSEALRNIRPLTCHAEEGSSEDCSCTPIQWGDMYMPRGTHQSHDEGYCIDVRAIRSDGEVGSAAMGRKDFESNAHLIQQLCNAGATTIYFKPDLREGVSSQLDRYNSEVEGCWIRPQRNHNNHIHVCFSPEVYKARDRRDLIGNSSISQSDRSILNNRRHNRHEEVLENLRRNTPGTRLHSFENACMHPRMQEAFRDSQIEYINSRPRFLPADS